MRDVSHTMARVALTSINDTGGFSLNANLVPPISGYMVSRKGMELKTNPAVGNIEAYLSRYWNMVNESKLFFGGWIDEVDGTLYLDVSENVESKEVALRLAFQRGQLAIYDVVNQETIYLPERKQMQDERSESVYLPERASRQRRVAECEGTKVKGSQMMLDYPGELVIYYSNSDSAYCYIDRFYLPTGTVSKLIGQIWED